MRGHGGIVFTGCRTCEFVFERGIWVEIERREKRKRWVVKR